MHLWYSFFQELSVACSDWDCSIVGSCWARRSSLNCKERSKASPSWAAPLSLGSELASSVPLPELPQASMALMRSRSCAEVWSHSFLRSATACTTSSISNTTILIWLGSWFGGKLISDLLVYNANDEQFHRRQWGLLCITP